MKIQLLKDPFPHVIIEDFYNEEELKLIWRELEFLTSPSKLLKSGKELATALNPLDNSTYIANSYGITLDHIYPSRNISDILTIAQKVYEPLLIEKFASLHPLMGHIKYINRDCTKIKYYEDETYYLPHWDTARFTSLNYFFKEPKQFSGGNLNFPEFNYTIEIKNNMMVLFVGSILHQSTTLKSKDKVLFSGNGKYCISKFMDIVPC
jgi:Rps23 Pro-64 3,4-dihydroxylase Tpa1-like proline 4-hydroxylase